MRTSEAGILFIADQEGFRPKVYRDVAGIATIGYGHKLRIGDPVVVTEDQALALLRQDVAMAEAQIDGRVKVPLNQHQYDALVSFVFNVGGGAFAASMLLSELNQGRYQAAADQLPFWDHAIVAGEKVEVPALKRRRKMERAVFLTPPTLPPSS